MDKLSVSLQISQETFIESVSLRQKLSAIRDKKDGIQLEINEVCFLSGLLDELIRSSVNKAYRLESLANDFLNCYDQYGRTVTKE